MAQNEQLVNRLREALSHLPVMAEKKMFQGICFMVNGKMCMCVRGDDMMCRIGQANYQQALEINGCRPMIHNGRSMKGYVFVEEAAMLRKKDFEYWVNLSLAFNKEVVLSGNKEK